MSNQGLSGPRGLEVFGERGGMNSKHNLVVILAKMALADGTVSEEEEFFLQQQSGESEIEGLLQKARETELVDLVQGIDHYPDKFFVAFRAASLALIDDDYDIAEQQLFQRLSKLLGLDDSDQTLIQEIVDKLRIDPDLEPPQRVQELFAQSSFV
jgi:thioredoxin-like negative regulator of GroEL